ncbi:MAG TPA: glutamate-1-semialdehyde 2,1-aminomutase, partial [Candidatus Krumholzibacteria bacterium]|nr:glutamate-1-semialdehyde 2,1-aminomutase [Candidatus Krumholzibacteria bacterium]
DQYPEQAPGMIERGSGCHVWDVDGNEYIEYGMGLRAVTLGHAYPEVVEAVRKQLGAGSNFTRPSHLEVELAESLLGFLPRAEMVKFCKDGSTTTAAAVRLARAHAGREKVAFCQDHPFFSYEDWFMGTTELNSGIPGAISRLSLPFSYNDIQSVEKLFAENPGQIAALIMEAERETPPADDFLTRVQQLCRKNGTLFVLDEMITGFRWEVPGAQKSYGLDPDLSCFGKAMSNGYALSALVGKREIMELGGYEHDRDRVFLLSTTHGAETHALAAGLAVLGVYRREDVVGTLHRQGKRLREGVEEIVKEMGLGDHFGIGGRDCNLVYITKDESGNRSQEFRTLFMQEIIKRGILGPSFVVSYSHQDSDIDRTVEAVKGALEVYAKALSDGVDRYLQGRSVKPVDRRRG